MEQEHCTTPAPGIKLEQPAGGGEFIAQMLLFTLIAILNTSLDGPGKAVKAPGFDTSAGEEVRQLLDRPESGNSCSFPALYPGGSPVDTGIFEPIPFPLWQPTIEDIITADPFEPVEVPYIYQVEHKHHIFPQAFRGWFAEKGIDVDDYTVAIDSATHLRGVHGRGLGDLPGRWNARWAQFIFRNPEANAAEIGQFASELMQEFGLDNLPIEPY
jgi:hypothetical protein